MDDIKVTLDDIKVTLDDIKVIARNYGIKVAEETDVVLELLNKDITNVEHSTCFQGLVLNKNLTSFYILRV